MEGSRVLPRCIGDVQCALSFDRKRLTLVWSSAPPPPGAFPPRAPGRSSQAEEGENFVIKLDKLGRGSSFGESELLAAAEAEEGAAALAAALKHRQNSQKLEQRKALEQRQQQQSQSQPQSQAKPVAMLVSAGGAALSGPEGVAGVEPSAAAAATPLPLPPAPRRKSTPGEGPGRGAARAVCVSEEDCEVMAVPRHLFANLLDELGGVRRKLELQVSFFVCVRETDKTDRETEKR